MRRGRGWCGHPRFSRASKEQLNQARAVLVAAIVEDRKAGGLIEDITAVVPYRQTQVNRILKDAGLTEERKRAAAA